MQSPWCLTPADCGRCHPQMVLWRKAKRLKDNLATHPGGSVGVYEEREESRTSSIEWFKMGIAFEHVGKKSLAATCYRRALEEAKDEDDALVDAPPGSRLIKAKAQYNLSQVLVATGDLAGAEAALRRCVDDDDGSGLKEAWLNLGGLLTTTRRFQDALQVCERGLQLHTDDPALMVQLNTVLRLLSRQQEAIDRIWACVRRSMGLREREHPLLHVRERIADEETLETSSVSAAGDEGCVCFVMVKWGAKYGSQYVNRLARGIRRHARESASCHTQTLPSTPTTRDIRVICVTDDVEGIDVGVVDDCVPLPAGLPLKGWWVKAYLFSPALDLPSGCRVVYMDLDTVITGPIHALLDLPLSDHGFATLRTDDMVTENRRCGGLNTSVMVWKGGCSVLARLYTDLLRLWPHICKCILKFDHWVEMWTDACADEIGGGVCIVQEKALGVVAEYKALIEGGKQARRPDGASIVCFPLRPKPHDCCEDWIKEAWA